MRVSNRLFASTSLTNDGFNSAVEARRLYAASGEALACGTAGEEVAVERLFREIADSQPQASG